MSDGDSIQLTGTNDVVMTDSCDDSPSASISFVLPETSEIVEEIEEETEGPEFFGCFAKKDLLTVNHQNELHNEGPIIGTLFIGELEEPLVEKGQLILHKHGVAEENDDVLIFKLFHRKKTSPWKGLKQYTNVTIIGKVKKNNMFNSIREIYIPDIQQAGFSFSWFLEESTKLMFNLHIKNANIYRNINYVDLNKTAKCFEDRRPLFHSQDRPNALVINDLLALFRPELQKVACKLLNRNPGANHLEDLILDIQTLSHRALLDHQPCPLVKDLRKRNDFEEIYEKLRNARDVPPSYKLRLDSLACSLRPYQRDAVNFMLYRELEPQVNVGNVYESIKLEDDIHYFPSLGAFVRDASEANVRREVCGGILADEMGLGKTMELLSLILTNATEQDAQELVSSRNLECFEQKPCCSSDLTDVDELLIHMVSTVSAACDGEAGLKTMKKAKSLDARAKRINTIYNMDSHFHSKYSTRTSGDRINCEECGSTCSRKKMHWLSEFDDQGLIFKCPSCVSQGPILPISATLIVVPQAICHQWFEEIKRHVKENVKIDMYMGVASDGYKHPYYLNTFNIVITTYEILRQEFAFMKTQREDFESKLRKRSYAVARNVTTPLLSIYWWRVCLDESQLVENTRSRVVDMCWNIQARARWCVTGTPLVVGCGDFFSLLSFLHVPPFHSQSVWDSLIYNPYFTNSNYEPMISLIKQLFWRNSKKDVEEQLDLPPITQTVVEVILTPLELEFYKDIVAESKEKIEEFLQRVSFELSDDFVIDELPSNIFNFLTSLLFDIRLVLVTGDCSLPEMKDKLQGRNHLRGTKLDAPCTPEALFKKMLSRCKVAIEEYTRQAIFNVYGLANHSRHNHKIHEAFDFYKYVLSYMKDFTALNNDVIPKLQALSGTSNDWLTIDTTQLIHLYTNLIELVESHPSVIQMDPDELYSYKTARIDANSKFKTRSYTEFKLARAEYNETLDNFTNNKYLFRYGHSSLLIVLDGMDQRKLEDLTKHLNNMDFHDNRNSFFPRWHLVWNQIYGVFSSRQTALESFVSEFESWIDDENGFAHPDSTAFLETMDCAHNEYYLTKDKKEKEEHNDEEQKIMFEKTAIWLKYSCPMCLLRQSMLELEKQLSITGIDDKSRSVGARRQIAEVENQEIITKDIPLVKDPLYQAVLSVRNHASKSLKTATSASHEHLLKWFEHCRKIIKSAQTTLNAVQELVFRHREMVQAGTAVYVEAENKSPQKEYYALFRLTGDYEQMQAAALREELATNEMHRKELMGRMSYMISLQEGLVGDSEARECPVCYEPLNQKWMVLPCIHAICINCYSRFIQLEPANRSPLRCVTCRAVYHREQVHIVQRQLELPDTEGHRFDFRGLQLTFKFDSVMRKIVEVLNEDRTNKIIVFSSMQNALTMLSGIMSFIDMPHTIFATTSHLERLAKFKHDPTVNVLLLPFSFGANGLNLVEANHVFFLEPIPDTSVFQQAIGRVYRMGQNRACTIHHFVTKDTIEEAIYSVSSNGNDREGLTYGSFKQIFKLNQRETTPNNNNDNN